MKRYHTNNQQKQR